MRSRSSASSGIGHFMLIACLLLAFLHGASLHAQTDRDALPLRLLDGRVLDARVVGIDKQLALWLDGHERPIDASAVVQYGQLAENLVAQQIVLADGSVLVAELRELGEQRVLIGGSAELFAGSSIWPTGPIPRAALCGVMFRPPPLDAQRDQLLDELLQPHAEDRVWLDNGDRISGRLLGSLSGEDNGETQKPLRLQVGTQELAVPRESLVAIALRRPAAAGDSGEKTSSMLLGFRDGSRLYARQMHIRDGNMQWQLAAGGTTLQLPTATAIDELCCFRPLQPAMVFLSDVSPLGYAHVPLLELRWPHAEDRSVVGGRLRTSEWLFDKGLGMHSTSRLAYELPQGALRFQAELALDRSSGQRGSVQGRVYLQSVDGQWTLAYETPIQRGGQPPHAIDLALGDARALALIVDQADHADQLDRANWLGARITITPE